MTGIRFRGAWQGGHSPPYETIVSVVGAARLEFTMQIAAVDGELCGLGHV
jgi:hypothetical protein